MAYLMIESSVRTHRKFIAAGPAACWLWVCGLGYCQDGLTDGRIPTEAIEFLGVRDAWDLAEVLVRVGLWEVVAEGWRMHDYLDHNKSADHVRAIMRQRMEGGKKGGRPRKPVEGVAPRGFGGGRDGQNLPENLPRNLPETPTVLPSDRPPDHPTGESSAPPAAREPQSPEPVVPQRIVLTFPIVGPDGPRWDLTVDQVREWRELFPGLRIVDEARHALAWVRANPGRRKTATGMPRFLVHWFTKAVNAGQAAGPGRRIAEQYHGPSADSVDWFEECNALHGGACGLSRQQHETRKTIEAGRQRRQPA